MLAKIQKWGNSLALRIPKAFADEMGLTMDSAVEIRIIEGQIHIVPIHEPEPHYDMDALLNDVTDENRHGEVDTGPAMGHEMLS